MRNPETGQGAATHQGKPLHGVRVLDFSRLLAGPLTTMLLAAQGADVIAVDSLDEECAGNQGKIRSPNIDCGKRSLALDLQRPDGISVVRQLLRSADVLVQDFQPGTAEALGLDPETVRSLRTDIVYVALGGFDPDSACTPNGASRPIGPALPPGPEVLVGHESGRCPGAVGSVPDSTTALLAHQAIVTALSARERSGEGHMVNLALLDTALAFLWPDRMGESEPEHLTATPYAARGPAEAGRKESGARGHRPLQALIDIFGFAVAERAPAPGEHTIDLLRELGYTERSIDLLIEDRVVRW